MKVLLVEPGYKNKYPPMGLMKISTYHKQRGDEVHFFKGLMPVDQIKEFDRVYITSLFTFYYDMTKRTVEYYKKHIDQERIYIGGIMVTILEEKVRDSIKGVHILTGLLTDSECLGLNDHVNIDILPLDYSILDESEYKYPTEEDYFSYTTRGCPNHCSFCAVPTLEPEYKITNNIYNQIMEVNEKYGPRRNLLLLDNNIFNLEEQQLRNLVDAIKAAGFTKKPTFVRETIYERILRKNNNTISNRVLDETEEFLKGFQQRIKARDKDAVAKYKKFVDGIDKCNNRAIYFWGNAKEIRPIIEKYKYKTKLARYVDFNQGLEAGRITREKMAILSELPLRPVRIAFDHYNRNFVEKYKNAICISAELGIKDFSNYMLYNFTDKPDDLWYRLKINIDLAKEMKINIFSFPMKYMPITETDRKHIGKYWNKKYLSAVQAILLVTKGVVADGENFFYRAFGHDCSEFYEILMMPKDFIIYRSLYEEMGLKGEWKRIYDTLNDREIQKLLDVLNAKDMPNEDSAISPELAEILVYYEQEYTYNRLKKNPKYSCFFDNKEKASKK